jgi:RNA polymerase sigma-70 factor (ECF subfamily)
LTLLELGIIATSAQTEEILTLLRERIVSFAASRSQRDRAEDVAQKVLHILIVKYPHVSELTELVPLSLKIARFVMIGEFRTSNRRGEGKEADVEVTPLPAPGLNPEEQADRKERVERLKAAMESLGERCRDLIRYKLQGKSFPEIQRLFQIDSINTIYTWDLRCRKQLLEAMGGKWGGAL